MTRPLQASVTLALFALLACGGEDLLGGTGGTGGTGTSAAQACVDHVNALRATLGLPALARWDGAEGCAGGQAASDSATGAAHGAFGACGERAQCECPGWSSVTGSGWSIVPGCLDMMWAEGPGGGHYDIMSSRGHTKVACGFHTTADGRVWAVQDYR